MSRTVKPSGVAWDFQLADAGGIEDILGPNGTPTYVARKQVDSLGNSVGLVSMPRITTTLTGSTALTTEAFGAVTPYNSGSSGTLTLPDAATCWALKPYGLVVVTQKGVGVPSFAAGGSDTLRATSGVAACVQYGMCAAQVISATEWALA